MATITFSMIHFNDQNLNQTNSMIVIRIKGNENGSITHNPISIDRCCKPFIVEPNISSNKDEIQGLHCNMAKEDFYLKHVRARKSVILRGCQKKWRARKWTFQGTFRLNTYFYCSLTISNISYCYVLQLLIFVPRNTKWLSGRA